MRAIKRIALTHRSAAWLDRQQSRINTDLTIDLTARWNARRRTMTKNGILATLQRMAGYRERCMYCGDSQACDIEHFRPKASYRAGAFVWSNLLWICQPCNRRKSKNFPMAGAGDSLILDPSTIDPWFYFIYVDETGEVVPAPGLVGVEADKANHTIDPKHTRLNIECVAEGRRRDSRTLRRAANQLIAGVGAPNEEAVFIEAATDLDHPELVQWFLMRQGRDLHPFDEVITRFPEVVRKTLQALNFCHAGI